MISNKPKKDKEIINSYIYTDLTPDTPKRYEMVRYSTWRIYAYNELESFISDFKANDGGYWNKGLFEKLGKSGDQKGFYDVLYRPPLTEQKKQYERYDNISHFIGRMLYCREQTTKYKFISMQKRILENRLRAYLNTNQTNSNIHRSETMKFYKKLYAALKQRKAQSLNITIEQWNNFSNNITFHTKAIMGTSYNPTFQQYAKLRLEEGDIGLRKRKSFMYKGFIYINCQTMIDIIVACYDQYLQEKLSKTEPIVSELIAEDIDNQFAVFLSKTIKQIYEETMDEEKMNGNHKLTLRNVDYLSEKVFPPCMLNLNQHLKKHRHLKHDGRRQLWTFFKSCGMQVHDNKQYFRRHFEGKVTASEMKGHMYNIEHAYGLKGQRKDQHSWTCRGIISNPAPKKGEHHGCPFAHWRSEDLSDFLRKNYKVTENKLDEIMKIKQDKHFQIACGRLFEYADTNYFDQAVPPQITGKLGRAPHMFFEAGMDLRVLKQKKKGGNSSTKNKQESKTIDIEF